MRYFIDAQLPLHLKNYFNYIGLDCVHLLDIDSSGRMTYNDIINHSDKDSRIIVSKDADFLVSHILKSRPQKLLLISTGNIRNEDLVSIFKSVLPDIDRSFKAHNLIEISNSSFIIHD